MCLTRIYVRRKRDGRIMRFNSASLLRRYRRDEHLSKRTLPEITRDEFRLFKGQTYENPTWVLSTRYEGMALLAEG